MYVIRIADQLKINLIQQSKLNCLLLADFCVVSSFSLPSESSLKPLLALHGVYDDLVTLPEREAWSNLNIESIILKKYPGDHFFIKEETIAESVTKDLIFLFKVN